MRRWVADLVWDGILGWEEILRGRWPKQGRVFAAYTVAYALVFGTVGVLGILWKMGVLS